MKREETLTEQEWLTLRLAPIWVFTVVAAADGRIDERESLALATELAEYGSYKNALAQEVFASVASDMAEVMEKYRQDRRDVTTGLRDVASLLDRKLEPEESRQFKMALLLVGKKVSEASEGSQSPEARMGPCEKMALDLVIAALGIEI